MLVATMSTVAEAVTINIDLSLLDACISAVFVAVTTWIKLSP